ncbi:hypothetical protein [Zobellella sp. An-6]|uniref:hypothetical protein n=1 Tax=Zobellella sp. An-6 TaxID=3400218 RepID=UPI0040433E0D
MLARQCSYTLQGTEPLHAHIVVNPTGLLEVDIIEHNQHFTSEFEHVYFKRGEQGMELVCEQCEEAPQQQVSLTLQRQDAFELYQMIDDAKQELECLLCDL